MRVYCLLIFISATISVYAQDSARQYLIGKAENYLEDGNSSQARYHYLLALKQKGEQPTDQEIKQKVIEIDSIVAYGSDNVSFVKLISKADSLFSGEKYIEAMKFFDDASVIEPSMDYPSARINQIIESSKEIQKKLLIYNAKQNQLAYSKALKDIEQLEASGDYVQAYFSYLDFVKAFHGDSLAKARSEEIYKESWQEIDSLLNLLSEGNDSYRSGKFTSAKELYTSALQINPGCQSCKYRLEQIDYCLKSDLAKNNSFDENVVKAKESFKKGKYQQAYYLFYWLHNQQPENVEVNTYMNKLEDLLLVETDDRMKKFNADINLEKGNKAFLDGRFEDALNSYMVIKNRYAEIVDYLQFVELRISECLNELEN